MSINNRLQCDDRDSYFVGGASLQCAKLLARVYNYPYWARARVNLSCSVCGFKSDTDLLAMNKAINDYPLSVIRAHDGISYHFLCKHKDTLFAPEVVKRWIPEFWTWIIYWSKDAQLRHLERPKEPIRLDPCPTKLIEQERSIQPPVVTYSTF